MTPRLLALAAFTALLPALGAGVSCETVVGLGQQCNRNADCPGSTCTDGFCDVGLGEGEGEGAPGEGEGEGAPGEGEGEGAPGEGEGEGAPGEGEGEGEGEGAEDLVPPPRTCLDLLTRLPGTTTGNYPLDLDGDGALDDRDGNGVIDVNDSIHCDMDRDGGGWTLAGALTQDQLVQRLSAANPNDPPCPGDWQLVDHRADLGFIGCDRNQSGGGARAAVVPALFPYKDVMGTVVGVMFGDADAFFDASGAVDDGIDAAYADGVAVTTVAPRQHVFTFLASHPLPNQSNSECPCAGGPPAPGFVGNQLFCATASCKARDANGDCNAALQENQRFFDPTTPVWDGSNFICTPPAFDGPFFLRDGFFSQPAQTDLELRIMDDQASSDEDMAVTHVEIYIRE